jgi:hypothetical protein
MRPPAPPPAEPPRGRHARRLERASQAGADNTQIATALAINPTASGRWSRWPKAMAARIAAHTPDGTATAVSE